jgi:hypothetical protein
MKQSITFANQIFRFYLLISCFLFSFDTTVTVNVTKDIGIYYLGKRIKTEIIETQVQVKK